MSTQLQAGSRPWLRYWPLVLPVAATIPGLILRFSGADFAPVIAMLLLASAVVGAAFFLSWGTELAERDIGQGLALALLALIAVLPEYAVDTVFAWKAGQDPEQYAPLALANMTGANRLLIGVGWSVVVLASLMAHRRKSGAGSSRDRVTLAPVQQVEVAYLAVASMYALTFVLRESINLLDTIVLFSIFAVYLVQVSRVEGDDEEGGDLIGPAARIAAGPASTRRFTTALMLLFAGSVILAEAEQFAESLVATGTQLGISRFLLVQWVAPLASETPEFIAVLILAWKLRGAAALGALISSKINQWTLLVGILPIVFAVSAGSLHGLPIDDLQREELFLTSAQSVFAVALVMLGYLSRRGAYALLGLLLGQFVLAWTLPGAPRGGGACGTGCHLPAVGRYRVDPAPPCRLGNSAGRAARQAGGEASRLIDAIGHGAGSREGRPPPAHRPLRQRPASPVLLIATIAPGGAFVSRSCVTDRPIPSSVSGCASRRLATPVPPLHGYVALTSPVTIIVIWPRRSWRLLLPGSSASRAAC